MNEVKVKTSEMIARSFYQLHDDVKRHGHTHYWLKGGRGSTKSSMVSIEIILGIMRHPGTNALCLRKVGVELKDSVFSQLEWAIDALHVRSCWKIGLSPLSLTYKRTGQKVIFRGADKPEKIKSIKMARGYIAYVWYEEVNEFVNIDEINTINRSVLRGGPLFWAFYTFNPPASINNWANYEVTLPRNDKLVHSSTYLTVPKEWLGDQFIVEAEHEKKVRPEKYRHDFLGEVTGTGGEVFRNVTLRRITQEEKENFDNQRHGLDWGYAGDPFAYIDMHLDSTRKCLYIYDEYVHLQVSNHRAAEVIKSRNPRNELVSCDGAEPKSVSDLRSYGVNATAAKKEPGSIERGIRYLAEELEEIIIDPDRCPNAAREFTTYELEKDQHGNFKSQYPDKDNHTIDATRYALKNDMRTGKKSIGRSVFGL